MTKTIKGIAHYYYYINSRDVLPVAFDYTDTDLKDLKAQIKECAEDLKERIPKIKKVEIRVSNSTDSITKSFNFKVDNV